MTRAASDRGQASIELLGVLPLLGVLALAAWQLVVLGESWWLAGVAARAAGRAELAGADARTAARAALPGGWGRRVVVRGGAGAPVVVRLRVPAVLGAGVLGSVRAEVDVPGGGP
jgi:hypothetical protein